MPELSLQTEIPSDTTIGDVLPEEPGCRPTVDKTFGLYPEASYILDCAAEMGDITPLEEMVFRLDNPVARQFQAMFDRDEWLPPHWLRNTARQFLASLPCEDRYVWALRSIPGLKLGLQTLRERIEFVVQTKVQSDLGVAERTSIQFLEEGTATMFSEKLFSSVHEVTQARVQAFVAAEYSDAKERLRQDVALIQEALDWWAQPGNRTRALEIAARLFRVVPATLGDGAVPQCRKVSTSLKDNRKIQRRARSAIKKALKLFSRTGLEDSVRMMVHGQEVELSHPASPFKFILQPLPTGWLEEKTVAPGWHVPYQLKLLTKEGVFLSRLCVLFDQTPVLDQLLALTFFVQAGHEADILSKANWFGYESAKSVRSLLQDIAPAFMDKVPAPREGLADNLPNLGLGAYWRTDEHWAPYKGPVRNWISAWMGELISSVHSLLSSAPGLA